MFSISKDSKIILYEAGERAKIIYDNVIKSNLEVIAVIDREPELVKYTFHCVVGTMELVKKIDRNAVVIVCLQNGQLHDEVASDFYEKGFKFILFIPTTKRYKYETEMRLIYQKILTTKLDNEENIPEYYEMNMTNKSQDIIYEDKDWIICWVSLEYIFSDKFGRLELRGLGKHISCLEPYITLFEYISGKGEYPEEYLEYSRKDEESRKKLLDSRVKLYEMYDEKMRDATYFQTSPIEVRWKEEKFYIADGHHRAVYLMLKGWYELPLKMLKEEYNMYMEYVRAQTWLRIARSERIKMYTICKGLLAWLNSTEYYVKEVYGARDFNDYVSWWVDYNDMNIGNLQGINIFVHICDIDEKYIELMKNHQENVYIIMDADNSKKLEAKKIIDLHQGYIRGAYRNIGIYKLEK